MRPIAFIYNDYIGKFGIPRQPRLAAVKSRIVFEPEYAFPEALRGLEEFSHIWLIWDFSQSHSDKFSPTVRPPRLGGNKRMGVFATRSPNRPNSIGMSAVKLLAIEETDLIVEGADLMNGTPIYDIKPYVPFSDSIPDAKGGFSDTVGYPTLEVRADMPLSDELRQILAQDPRPHYQEDPERIYGMSFGKHNVKFKVEGNTLTVVSVEPAEGGDQTAGTEI